MLGRDIDMVQEATNRIHEDKHDEWAQKVVLCDTYQFLEGENFHSGLTVIELLTGVDYASLEQWFEEEEKNYTQVKEE